MGAKDWMVFYAERDVPSVLRSMPSIDRGATADLVRRLFPHDDVVARDDVTLLEGNPPDDEVYAAVWPGATVVCTSAVALDLPSTVPPRFLDAGVGRTIYLHAMHSVVDWCAFAVWNPAGELIRALSVSPEHGTLESIGEPLPFESPFWGGQRPALDPDDEDDSYPLPFHPLELGEAALDALFGFVYEGFEGMSAGGNIDPEDIAVAAFSLTPQKRGFFRRR